MLDFEKFGEAFAVPDEKGQYKTDMKAAKVAVMGLVAAGKITYRTKAKAAEGVLAIAEEEAERRLEWRIASELAALVAGHAAIHGERAVATEDNSEWDALLEECLEDYAAGIIAQGIGQDGIGEAMNRLNLDMPSWSTELVRTYVSGAVAGLTREKTPTKVLSSIGIVKSDLEALVVASTEADPATDDPDPSNAMFQMVGALRAYAQTMGATDTETLALFCGGWDHIREQLWSSEPALQASALTALDAVPQAAALKVLVSSGADVKAVFDAVFSSDPAPEISKPRGRKKRSDPDAPIGVWNGLAARMREILPGKDGDKAASLGMSRSAFGGYATEKKGWAATFAEYTAALAMVDAAQVNLVAFRAEIVAAAPDEDEIPF